MKSNVKFVGSIVIIFIVFLIFLYTKVSDHSARNSCTSSGGHIVTSTHGKGWSCVHK